MRDSSIAWICSFYTICQSLLIFSSYENKTSRSKLEYLWEKIESSEYRMKPELSNRSWGQILIDLRSLLGLGFTFNCALDEVRSERLKLIHRYGSVAKAEWIPNKKTNYTGLFATGSDLIIRLSLAANPDNGNPITPGMALKFLVDGLPSRNLVVMNSLDGQGDNTNFFLKDFTHHIASPSSFSLRVVESIFSWVHSPPGSLSILHLAEVDRRGKFLDKVLSPDQIIFRPHESVNQLISSDSKNDFRDDLESIPNDKVLYEVFALNHTFLSEELLGSVVLKSRFKSSSFGDKHLFFQHHR